MADMKNMLKGSLYIAGGCVLLLNTLNILKESLNYILIVASIAMILYGFLKTGLFDIISSNLSKISQKSQNPNERR